MSEINNKYGLVDISLKDYRRIGMVDLMDDVIHGFDDHNAAEGVSNHHRQALLDTLVNTRNNFAKEAGIKLKRNKPYKRKFL